MSDIQAEQVTDPAVLDTPPADPAPTDPPADDPPPQPDTSWVPKRISEITAARRKAEEERDALRAEIERMKAATPTDPAQPTAPVAPTQDIEKLADALAERKLNDREMSRKIAAINEAGAKEFGDDFEKSVQNLNMAGIGGPEFLRVLTNIDGAEKVVTYLGKPEHLNEAIRIGSLDPLQMGIEMMKLTEKANKAFAKQISRAPAPIEPVTSRGNAGGDGVEPDPSDQKAWIAWRNKSARKKR
ncbi:hypothetical protein [Burkholderia cepacia]|uniref:hypothetical protein n=1 Tax=Burkholderia cepacia TaxID=292 RepID=UPI001F2185D1|nr:hypothetical protein [Burkholderia cepacia]UIY58102.1 hypothetical protein LZ568_07765 [Burkholderia cepacia]